MSEKKGDLLAQNVFTVYRRQLILPSRDNLNSIGYRVSQTLN